MNQVVGIGVVSHVHQGCLDWVHGHSHDTNHDYVTFCMVGLSWIPLYEVKDGKQNFRQAQEG